MKVQRITPSIIDKEPTETAEDLGETARRDAERPLYPIAWEPSKSRPLCGAIRAPHGGTMTTRDARIAETLSNFFRDFGTSERTVKAAARRMNISESVAHPPPGRTRPPPKRSTRPTVATRSESARFGSRPRR